jgi:hypothetical protein
VREEALSALVRGLKNQGAGLRRVYADSILRLGEKAKALVGQIDVLLDEEDEDIVVDVLGLLEELGPLASDAAIAIRAARWREGRIRVAAEKALQSVTGDR